MEAVARKLVGRDIIPEVAGLCGLDQQVLDHVVDLLLRSGDVHTSMQECSELGAGVLMGKAFVGKERVSLEHSFEPFASVTSLVPDLAKAKNDSLASASDDSQANAKNSSIASGVTNGKAKAKNGSGALAQENSKATAKNNSTARAEDNCTAKANNGEFEICF